MEGGLDWVGDKARFCLMEVSRLTSLPFLLWEGLNAVEKDAESKEEYILGGTMSSCGRFFTGCCRCIALALVLI